MRYILGTLLLLIIILSGCISKQDKYSAKDGYVKVSDFKIEEAGALKSNEWECYDVQYDRVCCPINWKASQRKNVLIGGPLGDTDENTFFVVLRHDEQLEELNLIRYLGVVYDKMKTDTSEKLLEYNCKKLIYTSASKEVFFVEFLSEIKHNKYIALCMYVSQNGLLYDITLKVPEAERDNYYEVFQTLLYNYKANGKYLFDKKEKLTAFKYISLDTLEN